MTITKKTAGELTDNADIKIGKVIVKSSDENVVAITAADLTADAGKIAKITSDGTGAVVTLTDGKVKSYADKADVSNDFAGVAVKAAGSVTISKALDSAEANTSEKVTGTYTGNLNSYDVGDDVNVKLAVGASGETALSNGSKALLLSFQVGADTTSENKISVTMDSMSAKSIGVDAIKQVSKQRSALGAVQNRLEHTISNLDNVVENTTSAESRIRDTDMAEEMVSYSKNNILMQAGQFMLAQANQQNQGVLSLLQ